MSSYTALAQLPLEIEEYTLERLEQQVSSGFLRVTTVVRLRGGGCEGIGEDVTYEAADHDVLQGAGPVWPLTRATTLDSFSHLLDGLELFPEPAHSPKYHLYRRWGFESAALDLALRQSGASLASALGLTPRPVRFVVSLRLGEPPNADPILGLLKDYPHLRFKLDPTSSWSEELVAALAATGAVDAVDFKGQYKGTIVDQPADPDLYQRVVSGFPQALVEDPALTPETEAILADHQDRVTWDAPISSVADIVRLTHQPKVVNLKPSRTGFLREVFRLYDYCSAKGIAMYGGGQFELGPGRGQIQYLASLFHPDGQNDVAPRGYNATEVGPGLPTSPLQPRISETGFRWE